MRILLVFGTMVNNENEILGYIYTFLSLAQRNSFFQYQARFNLIPNGDVPMSKIC